MNLKQDVRPEKNGRTHADCLWEVICVGLAYHGVSEDYIHLPSVTQPASGTRGFYHKKDYGSVPLNPVMYRQPARSTSSGLRDVADVSRLAGNVPVEIGKLLRVPGMLAASACSDDAAQVEALKHQD